MNKLLIFLAFMLLGILATAQISTEAWDNYEKSTYQEIDNSHESDAIIIFNRTYLTTNRKQDQIEYTKTIHRKIKINSLYGLEQFNKLYIPTYSDLHIKSKFINCKAKTLKKDQTSVITDTSAFVNSTLPANSPFYYKMDGNVRMLALRDINIGDEIEYIYSLKFIYDFGSNESFFITSREPFSGSNYCMEKSIIFDTEGFNVKIWPYNFTNGANRETDFNYSNQYGEGEKVMLNDIAEMSDEIYSIASIEEPYINYIIANIEMEKQNSWENFANDFEPSRKETKGNYIFDGEKMRKAFKDIDKISGIKNKYAEIHKKINQPLQDYFSEYYEVKNDIDAAWSYAKILSKITEKLDLSINFHFVKSKDYGKIDTTYQTLYQFQNIICSFVDEEGTTYYFPLLEPYSDFNDIRNEFQGVECFTIKQDERGKRTYEFSTMPSFNPESFYIKEVNIKLSEEKEDTLSYIINETFRLTGNVCLEVKPIMSYIIKDSSNTIDNFKQFIRSQVMHMGLVDSIHSVEYKLNENDFTLSYQYEVHRKLEGDTNIISINLDDFVENDFYTPFHLRKKRDKKGYIHNEYDTKYSITLDLNGKYQWMENELLKKELSNSIGKIKSTYTKNENGLTTNFELIYYKEVFTPDLWNDVLELRDISSYFLKSNFYFQRK